VQSYTVSSQQIKRHVKNYYESLFTHRHRCKVEVASGRQLARELGYPVDLLADVPPSAWEDFAPCGNPLPHVNLQQARRIINLGSGIGLDALAIGRQVPGAKVINIDPVIEVLSRSATLFRELAQPSTWTEWVCADGEQLPLAEQCADLVLMNGVFNLFPEKRHLLQEVARVLESGGRLIVTDYLRSDALPPYFKENLDAWVWCMNGACTPDEIQRLLRGTGFDEIRILPKEDPQELFFRAVIVAVRL